MTDSGSSGPKTRTSLLAHGQPMVWVHGGAMVLCLAMIVALLVLILYEGVSTFWPGPVVEVKLLNKRPGGGGHPRPLVPASPGALMGEVIRENTYQIPDIALDQVPEAQRAAAAGGKSRRRLLRTANFELTH